MIEDPRALPTFRVAVAGGDDETRVRLCDALLEVPEATDDDVARFVIAPLDAGAPAPDAVVVLTTGDDDAAARAIVSDPRLIACPMFVARQAAADASELDTWARDGGAPAPVLLLGKTPAAADAGKWAGIDGLRAALLAAALSQLAIPIDRARRAKRPYASAVIAGAAALAGAEGFLPGAAAFVVSTQIGAIMSLYYLYTGRWMGRSQVLTLLPVFASEAAGGSLFLLVKSVLPPTGIADVAAAVVAASLTLAMLGSVAWMLEHGYNLSERDKLREAFLRMKAKTKRERSYIQKNRSLWTDKSFWRDIARRIAFE